MAVEHLSRLQRTSDAVAIAAINVLTGASEDIVKFDPALRQAGGLPNPLNPLEHLGNVWPSSFLAFGGYALACMLEQRRPDRTYSFGKRVLAGASLGLAVSAPFNMATDTPWGNEHIAKYGIGILYPSSTSDYGDLGWGLASGTLISAGFALSRARRLRRDGVSAAESESTANLAAVLPNLTNHKTIATYTGGHHIDQEA